LVRSKLVVPLSALDQLEMAVALDLRRTLKHEVLEEVSQASTARDLLPRADVIPEADRRDRIQVVLGEHEAQAVAQPVLGRCQAAGTGLLRGRVTHGRVHPFDRVQENSCHCMKENRQACRRHPGRLVHPLTATLYPLLPTGHCRSGQTEHSNDEGSSDD